MLAGSLRLKLVLATVTVEILMLTLLVANSVRLTGDSLSEQAHIRIEEVTPLLNTSLATPLAQRDYASLQDILKESRRQRGIVYLVVRDSDGKIVASEGWNSKDPLPATDKDLRESEDHDRVFHAETPIRLAGQTYGTLHYGMALDFLIEAKSHLFQQSLAIAGAAVVLSIIFLAFIGYWLTRHLEALASASAAVTRGDFNISVPVRSDDEVGRLTHTFNTMTAAIRERVRDLSESKDMQRTFLIQVEEERARLASLLSAMNIGVLFVGADDRIVYYNPSFIRTWMITENINLVGMKPTDIPNHAAGALTHPEQFMRHLAEIGKAKGPSDPYEIAMTDGRVMTQTSYPIRGQSGTYIGRLWIYEDVTRDRQTAQQLIYLAERDSLTGLFNRRRFTEELARMVADVDRRKVQGTILFFDLDEFKYVNDTFGHGEGDTLLLRVATEVGRLIRRNEIFSRLGGDEFAVLIPEGGERDGQGLADRILRCISQIPFEFEGQTLRLTASIGIAVYPLHAANPEELITHADAAMYQAKAAGKNAWRVYRSELDSSRDVVDRLSWNERITHALEQNLLKLHFQGVYHTENCTLSHIEVLVRMLDEEQPGRLIMPGHFIPFAEKSGKILDIDRWVLHETIKILALDKSAPSFAVNISGRSFDDPNLPAYITEQLQQFKVDPRRLYVELTETQAVSDMHDAQRFIEALHQTGCYVCLDDFGAGFSSFAYLKHLKADILKIDGQFIRDLPNDTGNQLFVKAMVDVARGFGKITIAEFVEDAETLEMLKLIGIDMVQGYHLGKPTDQYTKLGDVTAPIHSYSMKA